MRYVSITTVLIMLFIGQAYAQETAEITSFRGVLEKLVNLNEEANKQLKLLNKNSATTTDIDNLKTEIGKQTAAINNLAAAVSNIPSAKAALHVASSRGEGIACRWFSGQGRSNCIENTISFCKSIGYKNATVLGYREASFRDPGQVWAFVCSD